MGVEIPSGRRSEPTGKSREVYMGWLLSTRRSVPPGKSWEFHEGGVTVCLMECTPGGVKGGVGGVSSGRKSVYPRESRGDTPEELLSGRRSIPPGE